MGRKRVPNVLKIIRGNPGRRPLPNEPAAVGELQEPPEWLTPSQKEGWRYAIEHAPRGLLKRIDSSVLVIWTIAEDFHREAAIKVTEFGMLIKTPNTGEPQQSPYMPIMNRQAVIMLRAVQELGFSPAARPSIEAPPSRNLFDRNGRRPNPDPDPDPAA
jgi:P27 family predicted phage terminase small subunit